jgi:hypothetical protein
MRLRRGAASAAPARGVRRRGRFPARTFPDPRPAAPRRPGRPARWRVFRAAKQARIRSRKVGAVGSRGPERARSGGDHLAQQVLAGCGAVGAPSGGNLTFASRQRSKHRRKSLRRLGAAAAARRRVRGDGPVRARAGAEALAVLCGDLHILVAATTAASHAGSRSHGTGPFWHARIRAWRESGRIASEITGAHALRPHNTGAVFCGRQRPSGF